MHINIEFLVVAYFISLFIDWIFQWDWQAVNKSKWIKGNYGIALHAVLEHSAIYSILTTIGLTIIKILPSGNGNIQVFVFSVLFISHILIDTRIPVKWIMRFKGMSWEQINDIKTFGFMHIGIDHRLHEMVLVILAMFI